MRTSFSSSAGSYKTVIALFEAQVQRTPEALAVLSGNQWLTYAELNERSNQLARKLDSLGAGPDMLVGVCMERSLEMVVSLLGILKSGAAYVPIDPSYPKDRLAYMMEDASPSVLLTQEKFRGELPSHRASVVLVDCEWQGGIAEQESSNLNRTLPEECLAYVIYTSGSTGRPKGAMNTHRGLGNRLSWMQQAYRLTAEDVVVQKTPFSFDVSVWEFFWPLLAGARLVMARPGGHRDSRYLLDLIWEQGITTLHFVPSMLRVFLDEEGIEKCTSLRRVICSGEALSTELQEKFFKKLNCELHNLYGPTEAAIDVTSWECRKDDVLRVVPIGRPIANTQIHVLDEVMMERLDAGVAGELHIGGAGVGRGYWQRPDLTAEKFVPNPLSMTPGERLYRTGDIALCREDGILEYLGRIDDQVKVRGFRIELGEIQTILLRHELVKDAVVVAHEDLNGDKRLVAYVVPHQPGTLTGTDRGILAGRFRDYLKQRLPDYMLPSAFVLLEKLPLNPNGKIDRNALPVPENWADERPLYCDPRTPLEEKIAQIWEALLNVDHIGVHENFFNLGGHSLLATQFLGQLRHQLNLELPFQAFFSNATIADLSAYLNGRETSATHLALRRASRENAGSPLSFSQERVWFLDRLHAGNLFAYYFQSLLRFEGRLAVPELERSLTEIIRRHEIFRTTFHEIGGRPVQVVHGPYAVKLRLIDLQAEADPEQKAQEAINEELRQPFDLEQLPLIDWVLVQLGKDHHLLLHREHHLVHDGWSFNLFMRELFELYRSYTGGAPAHLSDLPIQFADFSSWQRQWIQTEEATRQLDYWKKNLAGIRALLTLPWDRPRPPVPSYRGGLLRIELPLDLCDAVRAKCREYKVTLFMAMFAGFVVLMQRLSGETDLCVGAGIANRRWKETHDLIGMTVNNMALRCDLSGNPTVAELLSQVKQITLAAYDNQDLPFDRVVEAVHPARDLSYHPLYQVMFSFHDSPFYSLDLPDCKVTLTEAISNGSAKQDINVNVIPRAEQRVGVAGNGNTNNGITVLWEYSDDVFDRKTMEHWIVAYQGLLCAMISDSERHIDDLPLVAAGNPISSVAESFGSIANWREKTLHELFEEQAEKNPESPAVSYRDQSISYGELNGRANQLAHRLIKLGAGPETRIGICVERSIEMVVGILGILKAGAAYVPLDPNHPAERLAFAMKDAAVPVLLTQQRLRRVLPKCGSEVISLDDWASISSESTSNPITRVCAGNLAYVIYTSGSTGTPKGVEVTHGNVARLFRETEAWFNFGAQDTWTLFHSYAFDFSVWELWGALLYGGSLVVVPYWICRSPKEFLQLLRDKRITVLNQTPSAFQQLIHAGHEDLSPEDSSLSLRLVIFGGEMLQFQSLRSWIERHDLEQVRLVNMYGITETTVHVTYCPVQQQQIEEKIVGSRIGIPIKDLQAYVLDERMQLSPVGGTGELYIAGEGLARGYLNRPGLTAERFVPDPFSARSGARLYRSGDLARYRADGTLEYLGRSDHQVKIRGYRIEIGEIEAVLNHCLAVKESAVVAWHGQDGDKRLLGYVVLREGKEFSAEELGVYLQENLPDYMVPQNFVFLESLPLSSNGKLDRKALPAPGNERTTLEQPYVAPRTPLEEKLAEIWGELLHVDRVGIYDNFFKLGGHSLLGTQVISRLRILYQVDVPLRSIFEQGTIAQLGDILQDALIDRIQGLSEEETQHWLESSEVSAKDAL
jgi:amino acid adenylation domain-containing protein